MGEMLGVPITRDLIVCDCGDIEHQLVVSAYDDEDEVYIAVHLSWRPFRKRLLPALRYLLGWTRHDAHYVEMVLFPAEADRLAATLKRGRP